MSLAYNVVTFGSGLLFGFGLDKAKTNVPWLISQQMGMKNMTMMKMFLAASAASMFGFFILDVLDMKKREARSGRALGYGLLGGFGANLVGGVLLGSGMYLSGSCPGTVWAQAGTGTPFVGYTMLGALLGALSFGYLEPLGKKMISEKFHEPTAPGEKNPTKTTTGYYSLVILTISAMVGVLFQLENMFPWQTETALVLDQPVVTSAFPYDPQAAAWNPAFAGLLIGLLQIPLQLVTGNSLGQSSGWVLLSTYFAHILDEDLHLNAPYLKSSLSSRTATFQILKAAGIFTGAALSRHLSGNVALSAAAAHGTGSPVAAFVGGFLLLFGARFGGGCTSGHMSGMSTLSVGSAFAIAGMFIGGGITSLFF